jgi:hypothetical protein
MTTSPHSIKTATIVAEEADSAPLFACEVEAGGTWLANGPEAPWAAWVAKARRSVMGGGRRWRLTRADGSVAWEGRCAEMPEAPPSEAEARAARLAEMDRALASMRADMPPHRTLWRWVRVRDGSGVVGGERRLAALRTYRDTGAMPAGLWVAHATAFPGPEETDPATAAGPTAEQIDWSGLD